MVRATALGAAARTLRRGLGFSGGGRSPSSRLFGIAAAIGAITGVRSLVVPATFGRHHAARGVFDGAPLSASLLRLAAAGEMLMDKLPGLPARTRPLPLTGRVVIAAACAQLIARQHRTAPWQPMALAGGVAAFTAWAATTLRRSFAADDGGRSAALGLLEDALVTTAADRLGAAIARRHDGG